MVSKSLNLPLHFRVLFASNVSEPVKRTCKDFIVFEVSIYIFLFFLRFGDRTGELERVSCSACACACACACVCACASSCELLCILVAYVHERVQQVQVHVNVQDVREKIIYYKLTWCKTPTQWN